MTASWETVIDVSGTSRAFSAKLNGTYYYRLMLRTRPVAGPASVEVDRAPTASISWNPSTVEYGGTSTLRWSAAEVTGCLLDGTNRGTSGSMVLANRTESQTSVLTCTTAGNGTVTDSATLTVRAAPQITIVPSPSPNGSYTVSWSAPAVVSNQTRLYEQAGDDVWRLVGTYLSTVTSKPFRNKPGGTYQYKTQLCTWFRPGEFTYSLVFGFGRSEECGLWTGPPMASISWNPSTVEYGGTSTLSWSATDVTGCTVDGTDEETSGSRALNNLTETRTSELSCTTAGNGTVTDSDTLTVRAPVPGITIAPSPSTDGNYTVSWSAPAAASDLTRLYEREGSDDWRLEGTYISTVTSRAFMDKPGGTYWYKTQLCTLLSLGNLPSFSCRDSAGPERVEVSRAPSAAVSWAPATVDYGGTATLTWNARNVTGCTLDGTDRGTSGSWMGTNRTVTQTSELSCTTTNETVTASATLHVRPPVPAAPTVSPEEPDAGETYTVSWAAVVHSTYYELQERSGTDEWMTYTYEKDSGQYGVGENMNKEFPDQASGDWKYRVRACNAKEPEVCSDWSGILALTVPETGLPSAMVSWNPSTVEYGGTSTLSWSARARTNG